jgi:hypothetical protein
MNAATPCHCEERNDKPGVSWKLLLNGSVEHQLGIFGHWLFFGFWFLAFGIFS